MYKSTKISHTWTLCLVTRPPLDWALKSSTLAPPAQSSSSVSSSSPRPPPRALVTLVAAVLLTLDVLLGVGRFLCTEGVYTPKSMESSRSTVLKCWAPCPRPHQFSSKRVGNVVYQTTNHTALFFVNKSKVQYYYLVHRSYILQAAWQTDVIVSNVKRNILLGECFSRFWWFL